jgi:hypothetical protein
MQSWFFKKIEAHYLGSKASLVKQKDCSGVQKSSRSSLFQIKIRKQSTQSKQDKNKNCNLARNNKRRKQAAISEFHKTAAEWKSTRKRTLSLPNQARHNRKC